MSNRKTLFNGYIELELKDKNGKLIMKRKEEMHSWLSAFPKILYLFFAHQSEQKDVYINITARDGNTYTFPYWNADIYFGIIAFKAPAGNDQYGILVGSGTKAVSRADYDLDNPIPNTTLNYGAVDVVDYGETNGTYKIIISRTFTNNSGSSITVSEVGLATRFEGNDGHQHNILVARDLLSTAVSVPDGSSLTVRYIIEIPIALA